VGCRGPSDAFIEKESQAWFNAIQRVFTAMTDIPAEEIKASLRSPQLSMFLFQFSDYASSGNLANAQHPADKEHLADAHTPARSKEKVL
jgi:hypothetical protein